VNQRKQFFYLMLLMIAVSVIVTGLAIALLYNTSIDQQQQRLKEVVKSQARLIEAVARFDSQFSQDYPDGSEAATISQLIDAHQHYSGFGETGEFVLARQQGNQIVFISRHRHENLSIPQPVNMDQNIAQPMKLALKGRSGIMTGLDYRGKLVLAAYEPVSELNLGLVAKIDVKEIRAPYITAAWFAAGSTLVVVLIGAGIFRRISAPVILHLENENKRLSDHLTQKTRELTITNNQLEKIIDTTHFCLAFLDARFNFIRVNQAYADAGKKDIGFFTGKNHFDLYPHQENYTIFSQVVETGKPHTHFAKPFEYKDIPDRGTTYWDWTLQPVKNSSGIVEGLVLALVDVTQKTVAQEELQLHSKIIENLAEGVNLVQKENGTIVYTNNKFNSMFGYDDGELTGKPISIINAPTKKSPEQTASEIMQELERKGSWSGEIENVTKFGESFWCQANVSQFHHPRFGDVWISVHDDITEKKALSTQIKDSLKEKETLLKEIHHRVKNNIQIISSLLRSQSAKFKEPETQKMIEEIQDRIMSIALVHEQLYLSNDLSKIDFRLYIENLVKNLRHSFGIRRADISVAIEAEKIVIDIETAVPCGLIINELLSNAFKYAFPEQKKGHVLISLLQIGGDTLCIKVQDNGIGLPDHTAANLTDSFGLNLVIKLVEHQLNGTIIVEHHNGTAWDIRFNPSQ
jgi:PAS domain S-box-containing protein